MVMKGIIFLDVLNFFYKSVQHIENFLSVKNLLKSVQGAKTQNVGQI